jgi:ADP-ribose pyrophosphatase
LSKLAINLAVIDDNLIIGVNTEQKVLLVQQYRIPVHARTIELPAGIIGDEPSCPNESSDAAALRELLEETGYAAGRALSQ